jgi:alkaline phosphatase D
MVGRWLLVVALLALPGVSAGAAPPIGPVVTHGVVVGDVTPRSALLWARADREATLHVRLSGGAHRPLEPVTVRASDDLTGQVELEGLRPATTYDYRAWFSSGPPGRGRGPDLEGSFETPPAGEDGAAVRVAFGGDVAGQNVCRDAAEGFPIMDTIRAWDPDVFVGLGDMIYADNSCEAVGRYGNVQLGGPGIATDLQEFWSHWRYNRADPASQRLLRSTSYVGVWDDHEVVNDFGPLTDAPTAPPFTGEHLLPIGLAAFRDYTPIGPWPLFRAEPKTMLGAEQLAWLKGRLAASDTTWKVIVSSVPMSIPTGFPPTNGRDGWANLDQQTGFERELLDILRFMADRGMNDTVWITTDVHFAEAFRYRPFADRPSFVVHELATGPLNAGIFPNLAFDTTLSPERLFFFGPATPEAVTSWAEAKRWFNFGTLEVAEDGTLTAGIVDTAGETEFSLELEPS